MKRRTNLLFGSILLVGAVITAVLSYIAIETNWLAIRMSGTSTSLTVSGGQSPYAVSSYYSPHLLWPIFVAATIILTISGIFLGTRPERI